ncbi:MAG: excinuclease ABC subunit C, partial [Desulfatitalea sp.]|nr:excinuclease ABC subunit C [Desulfatitalea sp.]NNJ99093.1 excinuclease ABC subunit C [Desulfatitalea sp.]
AFTLLRVRGGFLMGSRQFIFEDAAGELHEQMAAFLKQCYTSGYGVPREVVVSHLPEDLVMIESLLSEHKGARVTIIVPIRGDKGKLVGMAVENAGQALREARRQNALRSELLERLRKRLMLQRLPQRIECFDNSNLGGTDPVSGMVVFEDGQPNTDAYRRFKIQSMGKPDDYAYMAEVIRRRYRKLKATDPWPDLLLVDGGKGQLNVALAILSELGVTDRFDVAGIAKKNPELGELHDKIYLPGRSNPVQLSRDLDLLLFLQRIRDEAHRWSITFQRKRRTGRTLHSTLDDIAGVGPKRKAILLAHFGSVAGIRAATPDELAALPGISVALASTIKKELPTEPGVA